MSDAIVAALIAAAASVGSNIILSRRSSTEMQHRLDKHQAVTDTKLDELTREVREHNNFARRMPVVEQEIKDITKTVDKLQGYHME